MSYRLRNLNDPRRKLGFNTRAWYGLLELAEAYGWLPMGTVQPIVTDSERHRFTLEEPEIGDYWSDGERVVVFEDALNLADALQEAFWEYEPAYLASLYGFYLPWEQNGSNGAHPSLGAIEVMIEFCQYGGFSIERLT